MKKLIAIIICISLIVGTILLYPKEQTKYLRIHITSNSASPVDNSIKYEIKDLVCEYLTPLFLDCNNIEKAKDILAYNINNINRTINSYLKEKGFTYTSNAKLNNEYFPTRAYDTLVLDSGYYDALNISLGNGEGENWWCVLYPPMCLQKNTQNIEYKSRFMKIISQILG